MATQIPIREQKGFALLEVLVTVVVLAIGLLGLAGMQASALRYSQDAYQQTQAQIIIDDMIDRMRSNPTGVDNGQYDGVTISASSGVPGFPNCTTGTCSPAQIASLDIYEVSAYFQDVYGFGGGFVPVLPAGSSLAIVNNVGSRTLTLQWPSTSESGVNRSVSVELIL